MSDEPDTADPPDVVFITAARTYTQRTAGVEVRRISLLLADGTRRRFDVAPVQLPWPPREGWALRGDRGALDGRVFFLAGKSLHIFRRLLEANGGWVSITAIKEVCGWDIYTKARIVQNAVSKLRTAIREGLGMATDREIIEVDGDAYRLVSSVGNAMSA